VGPFNGKELRWKWYQCPFEIAGKLDMTEKGQKQVLAK
jgi:hypothetical protein